MLSLSGLLESLLRRVTELVQFLVELLCPPLAVYLPKVDHFAPVRSLARFYSSRSAV